MTPLDLGDDLLTGATPRPGKVLRRPGGNVIER
jgi:hypothetical protein